MNAGGQIPSDPAAQYVTQLSQSQPLRAALRDHDPVHRVPDNGEGQDYWVLSRWDDVFDALIDTATFSSASGLTTDYREMAEMGLEACARRAA